MGVFALGVQVAVLVVALQDAREHVDTISLVVKRRLGGEHQQVSTVSSPANLLLGKRDFLVKQ